MDHPAHLTAFRPRRSATTLIAGVATFELVLLIVAAIVIFGKPFAGEVEKAAEENIAKALAEPAGGEAQPATKGKQAGATPTLERSETSVLILNGNGRRGAANEAAGVVKGLEYVLAGTGDAPRDGVKRSVVMFREGYRGEAQRLASDVRVKRVMPLDGLKPRDLRGAHVVLMLGKR